MSSPCGWVPVGTELQGPVRVRTRQKQQLCSSQEVVRSDQKCSENETSSQLQPACFLGMVPFFMTPTDVIPQPVRPQNCLQPTIKMVHRPMSKCGGRMFLTTLYPSISKHITDGAAPIHIVLLKVTLYFLCRVIPPLTYQKAALTVNAQDFN